MERITNLRQSQPASSELDWTRHYLQIAQAANTPKDFASALNAAASHRRRAIREYTDHVRAERAWAARQSMFAAIPNRKQIDWLNICAIPQASLLATLEAVETATYGAAIEAQGETLRAYCGRKAVA